MDNISSPDQVKRAVAADWMQRKITYAEAARVTGYKYPTIANAMSNKKAYFSMKQALRLAKFGYDVDYLTKGKGTLRPEDNAASIIQHSNSFLPDDYKLSFLMECLRNLGDIYDDPLIQLVYVKFYKAITTKDLHECSEQLATIQQLIGIAMYQHGVSYDESGRPIYSTPKDDDVAAEGEESDVEKA